MVAAFESIPEKELRGLAREAMNIIVDVDMDTHANDGKVSNQRLTTIRYFLQRFGPLVRQHMPKSEEKG